MKTLSHSKKIPGTIKNTLLILGNFDGIHLAHQSMFRLGLRKAKILNLTPIIYTFNPHPTNVLAKDTPTKMINTLAQKIEIIAKMRIPYLLIESFTKEFAALDAEIWFKDYLLKRLKAKAIVVGYDFTFGKHRSGNVKLLQELCNQNGVRYFVLEPYLKKEALVSSSRIRQMIEHGQVDEAAGLLGRKYYVDGKIIKGDGRGKKLGIPTANLATQNELIPEVGVYATYMMIGEKVFRSITNIGFNPTFGNNPKSIETYVFKFSGNLYRKTVRLYFIERIRNERKFNSASELLNQIERDKKQALKILRRVKLS